MDPRKSKRPTGNSAGNTDEVAGTGAGASGEGSANGAGDAAGPSAGAERLGALNVEVDRAALLAEAETIAAATPASSSAELAPAALSVEAKAADVAPSVRMLVAQCSAAFAPGWEITKEENDGVADAASLVLAYWMPDGAIDPKYLALLTLAGSVYAVASTRRNPDGSFRSLRAAPAPRPAPDPAPLRAV